MGNTVKRLQFVLVSLMFVLSALGPAAPTEATSDKLPDLRMRRLTQLRVQQTADGRRLLRFTSVVVNVGVGRFEVHGRRPDTTTKLMSTRQRIYDTSGGYRSVSTPAVMFFAGDGHNHWHLRDLETFTLTRLGDRTKAGTGAKHAFCFFDNTVYNLTLPGAPQTARYLGCGHEGDLRVRMGLSVGWGDMYHYSLPGQYIDITGLKAGDYRLRGVVDRQRWFRETSDTNNHTWVDIRISRAGVAVLRRGPGA